MKRSIRRRRGVTRLKQPNWNKTLSGGPRPFRPPPRPRRRPTPYGRPKDM